MRYTSLFKINEEIEYKAYYNRLQILNDYLYVYQKYHISIYKVSTLSLKSLPVRIIKTNIEEFIFNFLAIDYDNFISLNDKGDFRVYKSVVEEEGMITLESIFDKKISLRGNNVNLPRKLICDLSKKQIVFIYNSIIE